MKLILNDIQKNFKEQEVLRGATAEFENGKIYGLLGRNGAGKTTLFSIIYKELAADQGTIQFEEDGVIRDLDPKETGMLFAETNLPDFLTGYEYIKFIIDITDPYEIRNIDNYFDQMDLNEDDRHKLMKNYSSGMKAKVSLLTLYIQKPKIILLDEPLTAVDVVSGAEIKKFFRQLKDEHIVVVSTHMLDLAKDMCDEIVLLHNGKLNQLDNLEKNENYEEIIIEALRSENV